MYWKHNAYKNHSESHSEKLHSVDEVWKYKDEYYSDYYVTEADTTLKTFGICSRSPEDHILNRAANKYILHYILSGTAGDIVYIAPNVPYSISSDRNTPPIYCWISFNGGKSEKYVDMLGLSGTFSIYRSQHDDRIYEILYDMMEVDHSNVKTALYLEAKFIELMSLSSFSEDKNKVKSTNTNKKIIETITYISANFRDPDLKLMDIANAIYVNETYLQRIFKKEMGVSIYQYISNLRMNAAVNLLLSSNYTVNEIANYVGYNDRRTFFALFKKRFGLPPTKYKQTIQDGNDLQ